jgi:hypothetical protein
MWLTLWAAVRRGTVSSTTLLSFQLKVDRYEEEKASGKADEQLKVQDSGDHIYVSCNTSHTS